MVSKEVLTPTSTDIELPAQLHQNDLTATASIKDQIIFKRTVENKSFRKIGIETGISYTWAMVVVHEYYNLHPELKPKPVVKAIPAAKPVKKVIKGHSKTSAHKTGEVADILVDGYAARVTVRFTNCGNPDCIKCRRDSDNKYIGHGPYKYLSYRDSNGSVVTKYLTLPEQQLIADAQLSGTKPINITIIGSKITIVEGTK